VPIRSAEAPTWTAESLDGTKLESTRFKGQILIVNFWATFCPPCLREIPELTAFHNAHTNDAVSVVALSLDQTGTQHVRDFVERNRVPYPTAMANASIADAFGGVAQIPSTFIIGRDGKFVAHYLGALTRSELERVIAPLTLRPTAPPSVP
jgi:peroxiredoxin